MDISVYHLVLKRDDLTYRTVVSSIKCPQYRTIWTFITFIHISFLIYVDGFERKITLITNENIKIFIIKFVLNYHIKN